MRIGVFSHGWWQAACEALGHSCLELPAATGENGNPHAADLSGRLDNARTVAERFAQCPPEVLLDNGGTGLMLVPGPDGGESDLRLLHEELRRPLLSHFIDPIVVTFQGLDWTVVWQCLRSPSWVKMVWDKAQVHELRSFGIENVFHLPMAAPVRDYDTSPVDSSRVRSKVSFVGGHNSRYFTHSDPTPVVDLFGGTLAMSVRSDQPDTLFYDIYHALYGLGEPVDPGDSLEARVDKARAYFNAKLFYNAALCVKNRDRFVVFLKRVFGDAFDLVGRGWDTAYGLTTRPQLPTLEEYFRHFRETAVNINLVTGNAETGLNMRHFEITAAGGFMLCYHQPELEEHFVIGKECDVFHSEHELLEKIRFYLTHPEERAVIARAGQKRTLAQHLYSHRLQTALRLVSSSPPPVEFDQSTWSQDMKRLLPSADVILDCGANTGQMARGFRGLYPDARIYSFEPVTKCFADLQETCGQIGAEAVKKAVSDRDGTAKINLTASPQSNSLLGYEPYNPCDKYHWIVDEEDVELCRLDSWCTANNIDPERIDIIKLDIQGAELQALKGAPRILKEAKMVLAEVSFVPLYKDAPLFEDIDAFMTQAGFRRAAVYPSDQPQNWGDALYVRRDLE